MTDYFEGTNNIVGGTARGLAVGDNLYVLAGVFVGSSGSAFGVTASGNTHVSIQGTVLSAFGTAFHSTGGFNTITIGAGGSVTGGFEAIELQLQNNFVTNHGSIIGDGGGIDMGGGELINTGIISTTSGTAVRFTIAGDVVVNAGTIASAAGAGIWIDATGALTNTIDNSGTIIGGPATGAIVAGGPNTVVTNTGYIKGNIIFTSGDDRYDGSTGKITGFIQGFGGSDTIIGGDERDQFSGGAGADALEGGDGRDQFFYAQVTESSSTTYDTLVGFDARKDTLLLPVAVTGMDPLVSTGQLRSGHVGTDLQSALGATALLSHHALLFTPDSGDLAGHTFLIVDADGKAGFKADKDFVFDLSDADNLNRLDLHNFLLNF